MTERPSRIGGRPPTRRLLLIRSDDPAAPPGGRAMLSRLNASILRGMLGDGFHEYRLPPRSPTPAGALRGHVDGVDRGTIAAIRGLIAEQRIDTLFLDGSNLGAVADAVGRASPGVKIVTFFHNVEARFFWGSLKARRTPKALAVLVANVIAERKAVRASDLLVCLSARDGAGLKRLYGRDADVVAPMVLADALPAAPADAHSPDQPYALFVGGGFYANIDGIRWFANAVAPKAGLHTIVVGRGMETLADAFADNPAVTLVGAVDDLAPWYRGATAVIAPIFGGSGMKTKVAEALMFGKRVVGTPEAFSGYDPQVVAAGWRCSDAAGFVAAIGEAVARNLLAFDPAMRVLYERFHSPDAARRRLGEALGIAEPASVA